MNKYYPKFTADGRYIEHNIVENFTNSTSGINCIEKICNNITDEVNKTSFLNVSEKGIEVKTLVKNLLEKNNFPKEFIDKWEKKNKPCELPLPLFLNDLVNKIIPKDTILDKYKNKIDALLDGIDPNNYNLDEIQCNLHNILETAQKERCELEQKLNKEVKSFEKYKNSGTIYGYEGNYGWLDEFKTNTSEAELKQCLSNIKNTTALKKPGVNGKFVSHKFYEAKGRRRRLAERAWNEIAAQSKCYKDNKLNLGFVMNETPEQDACHLKHNGLKGLIKYYYGKEQPRCDIWNSPIIRNQNDTSKISSALEHGFYCAYNKNKFNGNKNLLKQKDVCSWRNIISFKNGRRGGTRRARDCIKSKDDRKCNATIKNEYYKGKILDHPNNI